MRFCRLAFPLAALPLLACAGDAGTGPANTSLCDTRLGLQVCVDKAEVRQGQSVRVTVRNVTSAPIFKDGCSTKAVGKTSRDAEFEEEYSPTVQCGTGVGPAEIIAAMVQLAPSEVFEETIDIPFFAFQGFYRVNVWVLDAQGELASPTPAFSGVFEVFRTAD